MHILSPIALLLTIPNLDLQPVFFAAAVGMPLDVSRVEKLQISAGPVWQTNTERTSFGFGIAMAALLNASPKT
ncbi:MAG: hypothetical protein EAY75_11695 [Bacteroidetes bacterium]|nr:MAG: hypothetical protein EAY75_11695 [Bacteroidota bacterium]